MTLIRWQPKSLQNRPWGYIDNADWDRLFGWALGEPDRQSRMRHMVPAVDVREEEGRLVVTADLPGISKVDIDKSEAKVKDGVLELVLPYKPEASPRKIQISGK